MLTIRDSFRIAALTFAGIMIACQHPGVKTAQLSDPIGILPSSSNGARLPETLHDSIYWKMVREFSEPGGYFLSENFVSNEMGLQLVVSRLRATVPPGGVYMGVGPEQNFTYIAALKPRIAFIVDIRRQNLLQHLWYKAVFELSPTRAAFLSRLFARPLPNALTVAVNDNIGADSLVALLVSSKPDSNLFRETFNAVRQQLTVTHGFDLDSSDLATIAYVDSVFYLSGPELNYYSGQGLSRGNSFRRMPTFAMIAGTTDENGRNLGFLGSDSAYRVVRDMQRRNLIVPVVGNFSGPHAIASIGSWLHDRGARVGAFYVSNVEQYLFRQESDWNRFYGNVGMLPIDSNSQFIRSSTGGYRSYGSTYNGVVMMMHQMTSPIVPIVESARAGRLMGYQDVLGRSRF